MSMDTSSKRLNEREELILHAVVHTYITSAEPVGSRTIVKRYGLEFSPATVRNVMADLEEDGYIQQVHTSSGRVPTDKGYRYFVDCLMQVQELTLAERAHIERDLTVKLHDADEALRQTSHLLALVSHHTGIVNVPNESDAQVNFIELMQVSSHRVAVMIADSMGRVHTATVGFDQPLDRDELMRLSRFLNENFRGVRMENIVPAIHSRLRIFVDEQHRLAEQALSLFTMMPPSRSALLYMDGVSQLFEHPEFQDVTRAQAVFSMLDQRERLSEFLRAQLRDRGSAKAAVIIGHESHAPELEEISLVAAPYAVADKTVGMIGVLGPKRMHYSKITAVVEYTSNLLSRLLTRLAT
ncbi:MAG: heat-inducible transcription repressor HrcA [Candidatus Hydrogenedentota bacterium]